MACHAFLLEMYVVNVRSFSSCFHPRAWLTGSKFPIVGRVNETLKKIAGIGRLPLDLAYLGTSEKVLLDTQKSKNRNRNRSVSESF